MTFIRLRRWNSAVYPQQRERWSFWDSRNESDALKHRDKKILFPPINKQLTGANGSRFVKSIVFERRFGFRTAELSGGRQRGGAQKQREAKSRWVRALLRPGASTLSLPWTTAGSRKSHWRCSRGERITLLAANPSPWKREESISKWVWERWCHHAKLFFI